MFVTETSEMLPGGRPYAAALGAPDPVAAPSGLPAPLETPEPRPQRPNRVAVALAGLLAAALAVIAALADSPLVPLW